MSRRTTTAVGALLSATVLASGSAAAQPAPDGSGIAQQGDVVIDEIAADPSPTEGSYIVLHNTSSSPVDVSDWELFGCNTSTSFTIVTFPSTTALIPSNGSLLIASTGYAGSPAPDFSFATSEELEHAGGGVELADASFSVVEDVKWGSPHSDCSTFVDAGVSPDDDETLLRNTAPPPLWCKGTRPC